MLKRKKTIRRVSLKRSKLLALYRAAATQYKKDSPTCAICASRPTQDVHHIAGRGPYLLDQETWIPVCRPCHSWIHDHPGQARQMGYLV